MDIVSMQPVRQRLVAPIAVFVASSVGPFAQRGLDEAFGLAVGSGRIGPGEAVLDPQTKALGSEQLGSIGPAVVGQQPGDGDTQSGVEVNGFSKEADRGVLRLIGQDQRK